MFGGRGIRRPSLSAARMPTTTVPCNGAGCSANACPPGVHPHSCAADRLGGFLDRPTPAPSASTTQAKAVLFAAFS